MLVSHDYHAHNIHPIFGRRHDENDFFEILHNYVLLMNINPPLNAFVSEIRRRRVLMRRRCCAPWSKRR
jgi:hypothetical protein